MKRYYLDYLNDIVEYAANAIKFIEGYSFEKFITDDKTKYAVFRALEVIGEAAKKIPASMRKRYPEIEWKRMAGMRDKLIHEYMGINYKTVWQTVKVILPLLIKDIQNVIESYKKENPEIFN
jgi:uncharacterized protein with HEPN domain